MESDNSNIRKSRNQKLKESNPEEYKRRQDLKNENARKRYAEKKLNDPNFTAAKSEKRKQDRHKQDPEKHECDLFSQRAKYLDDKIEAWNNLFDIYFAKNNIDMPRKKWETLKQSEIQFFGDMFDYDISIPFLFEYRKDCLDFLRKNPDCPCGGSVLFYIKTFVHHEYDKCRITDAEKEFIKTVVLDEYIPEKREAPSYRKEYYEKHRDQEIEYSKQTREKNKSDCKNENLNRRFIDADPNKVLSVSDICFNPLMRNYSVREEYKVNLWKNLSEDEKPEFLEKWKIQRENYEKEVAELSVEYKTDFLKRMGNKDYSIEFENRNEKYLDHFRK